MLLAQVYREKKREADALREMVGYTRIQEHDHDTARLLFDRLVGAGENDLILELAPRLIAVQPMAAYVHEQYGRALAGAARHREAVREFEASVACGPRKPAPIRVAQARSYLALGDRPAARAAAEAAVQADPDDAEAAAMLKELE
jgi:hypothetical protein